MTTSAPVEARDGIPDRVGAPPNRLEETSSGAEDSKASPKDTRYKIQIGLSPKSKDTLFALREQTDVDSAAQVVRDALRVYAFLVDELSDGDAELLIRSLKDGSLCRVKLI